MQKMYENAREDKWDVSGLHSSNEGHEQEATRQPWDPQRQLTLAKFLRRAEVKRKV
jgi:hypothetical protein